MISLATYDNIEVGDTLTVFKKNGYHEVGVVESTRKWNGNAMRVNFTGGKWTEISRYRSPIILTVDEN